LLPAPKSLGQFTEKPVFCDLGVRVLVGQRVMLAPQSRSDARTISVFHTVPGKRGFTFKTVCSQRRIDVNHGRLGFKPLELRCHAKARIRYRRVESEIR
jgi:hypothetical protein